MAKNTQETMGILVKDFLNLPILQNARLVAGRQGAERRRISWISVIEWPVEGFVRPGEMVLTCGVGCTPRMFQRLVREIIDSGAAGLGIATGKKRDVGAVPKAVQDLANARKFPLVEIPWEVRFSDITKATVDLIIADRHSRLDDIDAVRRKFTDIISNGLGFDAIAAALESMLNRPVVILGPDFRLQAVSTQARKTLREAGLTRYEGTQSKLTAEDIADLIKLLRFQAPRVCPGLPALHLGAGLSIAVFANGNVLGYLYALETTDGGSGRMHRAEIHTLEQAAMAVSVEALRQRAVAEAESRLHGDFLWELATAEIGALPEIESRASLLGHDLRTPYYLALFQWERSSSLKGNGDTPEDLRIHEAVETATEENARILNLRTSTARRGNQMLLLSEAAVVDRQLVRKLAEEAQKQLARANLPTVACAIASGSYRLRELARGYSEVVRTVKVGQVMIGPGCVADAEDLGPFLMLSRLSEDPEACATAVDVLRPLIEYREKNGRDLLRTLEVYLEESGNASATARKLYLNRHSLLYRLNKIETLTGYSLRRYQDLFALNLSLKLWRIGVLPQSSNGEPKVASPGKKKPDPHSAVTAKGSS
jgi:purine catabolism regulator